MVAIARRGLLAARRFYEQSKENNNSAFRTLSCVSCVLLIVSRVLIGFGLWCYAELASALSHTAVVEVCSTKGVSNLSAADALFSEAEEIFLRLYGDHLPELKQALAHYIQFLRALPDTIITEAQRNAILCRFV